MTRPAEGLLIRADASPKIGAGHVMRCRALAQAWRSSARGGPVTFAMAPGAPALEALLREEGHQIATVDREPGSAADAGQVGDLARAVGARWVVVDGYVFGEDYQRQVQAAELGLLVLDDHGHAGGYPADLVLNQNLGAPEALYERRGPSTLLLLGLRYMLLREDFLRWRDRAIEVPPRATRVLVTMGGADPDNATLKVLQALAACQGPPPSVQVVAGASNPHLEQLRAHAAAHEGVELLHDVRDMPSLMARAELAVSAAGVTCWELAFMGVPTLLLVLADNQRPGATSAHNQGVAELLGDAASLSPAALTAAVDDLAVSRQRRQSLSDTARRLVDGGGAARVVAAMQERTTLKETGARTEPPRGSLP